MDLTIIIPSYNTKDLLDRCLSSIYISLLKSKLAFEIIVVDNASNDDTRKLLKEKYPRVIKIFNKQNSGYGKANNQGIKDAKGEYVLLLNSDIRVMEDGIERLLRFAKENPKSFAGGKLFNEDKSPQASSGPMYTLPVVFAMLFCKGDTLGITRYSPDHINKVDWVSGACLLGKKEAFVDAGLFDEGIFMYMEEIEFLYRAKQKGYTTLFYPSACFVHTGAASSGERKTSVLNIFRGLCYFYRKHRSGWEMRVLRVFLILKALAGSLMGRMIGRKDMIEIYDQALAMGTK